MKSSNNKPLTKLLLSIINDFGDSAVEFSKMWLALATHYGPAYGKGGSGYVAELKKFHKQYDLKRKLIELERHKYISINRAGRKFTITLTDKGRSYNVARSWKSFKRHNPGWFTVVIFDIPEQMSLQRRQWRSLLKAGGFSKLQQSVWLSKNDCYSAVAEFIKNNKVDRWINVYQATNFLNQPK